MKKKNIPSPSEQSEWDNPVTFSIPSVGLAYLPTFIWIFMVNVGKFIPYVDPMGSVILIGSHRNPYNGLFSLALLKSPMPGVIMGHLNDWDSLRGSSSLTSGPEWVLSSSMRFSLKLGEVAKWATNHTGTVMSNSGVICRCTQYIFVLGSWRIPMTSEIS